MVSADVLRPGAGLRGHTIASDIPQQVHIALAGTTADGISNGMAVSWVTNHQTSTSTVKYGTSPHQYTNTVTGEQDTYLFTWDHHVVLSNLDVSTTYYYVVGDDMSGWSEEFSFTTAPDNSKTFNVMIYGDMGVYNSDNTRGAIDRFASQYDLIWHIGDISYADDAFLHHPLSFHFEDTWNKYMNWMQNVTAVKPYMVLPGNHEAECHSLPCLSNDTLKESLNNFVAYNHRFRMPYKESQATSDMWYSFNYGPVHFVNIDTETDFPGAPNDSYNGLHKGGFGDQIAWLEKDLAKANQERSIRPWILVAGHRPVYSLGNTDNQGKITGAPAALAAAVEDLFYKYNVDMYFCGHQHSYERQWPVYKSQPEKTYNNPRAPVYIVQGAAGNTEGHTHYPDVTPSWSVTENTSQYGVGILQVEGSDSLKWTFYSSVDDSVIDQVTLTKKH